MKPNEYKAWCKVKEQGVYKCILINGAFSFGLPMFLVMYLLINKPSSGVDAVVQILIWLIAGLAFGLIMWVVNERRFKNMALNDKDQVD